MELLNDCLKNQLVIIGGACFLSGASCKTVVVREEMWCDASERSGAAGLNLTFFRKLLLWIAMAGAAVSTVIVLLQ